MSLTVNGTLYELDSDSYDGDMLLMSPSQDVVIQDGYAQLRMMAEFKNRGEDQIQIEHWMSEHKEEFVLRNFERGLVIVNK